MDEAFIPLTNRDLGGWKTCSFIIGVMVGVGMVVTGVSYNLEVYLIQAYHVGRIDATQINTVVSGCISLAPVVGGVIADCFLGCSTVFAASSASCFLGMLVFTLTATLPCLRPVPCSPLATCHPASVAQLTVLFVAIALLAAGVGGTRYNGMTMGASQFANPADRAAFFNYSFVARFLSSIAGAILLVYAQDSLGWLSGFALSAVVAGIAFLFPLLLLGRPSLLLHPRPKTGQLTSFRGEAGSLLALLSVVSTGILPSANISIQTSMTVLQALAMDRSLGRETLIRVPAGSINVFVLATAAISIMVLDRAAKAVRPMRRMGIGYLINAAAMAAMAATESRRLAAGDAAPVMWLAPALVFVGIGEAWHYPGGVAFYYQEFPVGLRSTATGTMAVVTGVGFYLSSGIVAAVRKETGWLKDNLNESRLDKLYGMMAVIGMANFVYFLVCACIYEKRKSRLVS
ncbi:hypothetical protein HPP92_019740 [Vanilla planifolia]|uniref:Major facilitator superfamily (MFS) profile domain-containing protein n=1 Tax=Vanilla planifolia TaxID=51239 RepID=A0A835PZY4_VANPL|nr:hypothetical protein HPP92_019740 [Vanilla planifolia]